MKRFARLPILASVSFLLLATAARASLPEGFSEAFKAALKAGDRAAMASLVEDNQDEAVGLAIATCEEISERPTEELEELVDGLDKAWREAFDTKFVAQQYEYFSLLRPEVRRARAELVKKFEGEREKFDKAMASGNYRELPGIGFELEYYAKGFVEIGDLYSGSEAWLMHAWSFEEEFLGDDAQLETSYAGFEQGIRLREEIGLEDAALAAAKERFQVLENAGVGDPETEFKGSLAGKKRAEAAAAAAVSVDLQFELLDDIDGKQRPYYCGDVVFQIWPAIPLGPEGSQETFPYIEDSPTVMRSAHAEAVVDADGDGAGDVAIPLTGAAEPVEVTLGSGDEARPWGFLAQVGQERDRYQGFDFNLTSDKNQLTIYIAPAASLVGEVHGHTLRVVDDNMDGVYGSEVKNWGYIGTHPETSGQADFDSLFVDKEKAARPWSPLTKLGDEWYTLSIEGTTLTAMPAIGIETGTLKLDFKGPKPDYVIVQGNTRSGECFFDLVPGGKKGTEVPVGTYYLISGRISKGKREQVMKALIVPPPKPTSYDLGAGETLTIELGAPFGFAFDVSQNDETATVRGESVFVTGRGGEMYQRLWNCVVTPDVSLRMAGSRKASKGEAMETATHQDDVSERGYEAAWFPWDLELPKKKAGEEVEVQLTVKKHRLFGKIESEWRK